MNPIVLELGPLTLRAYTGWLLGGVVLALGIMAWRAHVEAPDRLTAWLDVALVGIVAGVVGARALYVAQEWRYFGDHTEEITRLAAGGMAWHGALVLGAPAVWAAARLRGVSLRRWTDALALVWPLGMAAAWWGCRGAGCGYGYEVATLADWPRWLVAELPDVYGQYAPRLDVQAIGAAWALTLGALALLLTWRGWLRGVRLWVVLALAGLGDLLLAYLRADPAPTLWGHRADQVYDAGLFLLAGAWGGILWLRARRDRAAEMADNAEANPR